MAIKAISVGINNNLVRCKRFLLAACANDESTWSYWALARVRAARISVTQTPVFQSNVQASLTFPVLKHGDNYAAALPAGAA